MTLSTSIRSGGFVSPARRRLGAATLPARQTFFASAPSPDPAPACPGGRKGVCSCCRSSESAPDPASQARYQQPLSPRSLPVLPSTLSTTAGLLNKPLRIATSLRSYSSLSYSACSASPSSFTSKSSLLLLPRRGFATSYPAMAATKLDGTAVAKQIRERLAREIADKQKSNPRYQPSLKIIQGTPLTPTAFVKNPHWKRKADLSRVSW